MERKINKHEDAVEKEFKTENFIEKVAQVKNNNYICKRGTSPQIKIEEL